MFPLLAVEDSGNGFFGFLLIAFAVCWILRKIFKPRPKYRVEQHTFLRRVR